MNHFYRSLTQTEVVALLAGCKNLAARLVKVGINNNQPLSEEEATALRWFGQLFMAGKLTEEVRKTARLQLGEMAALSYRLALELSSNPALYESLLGKPDSTLNLATQPYYLTPRAVSQTIS